VRFNFGFDWLLIGSALYIQYNPQPNFRGFWLFQFCFSFGNSHMNWMLCGFRGLRVGIQWMKLMYFCLVSNNLIGVLWVIFRIRVIWVYLGLGNVSQLKF
jgi:hypothetical protein